MQAKQFFQYSAAEIDHLQARDKALAKIMAEIGLVRREVIPDIFTALVHAIVGQQISTKAQATVWARVQTVLTPLTPEHLGCTSVESIQSCGLSMRKAQYIQDIAKAVANGSFDLDKLHILDDAAVCQQLSTLRGIGAWTAEMLLIFSMNRMNVLSWGDLAIHRGLRMLYGHKKITPLLFAKYKKRYAPYASVASLYLWALAGGACPGYFDPGGATGSLK